MPRLEARLKRLEASGASRTALPSIWVRAVSREEDSQEVRDSHAQAARDDYIREHGDPGSVIGVFHYIIVSPKPRPEATSCFSSVNKTGEGPRERDDDHRDSKVLRA